MDHLDSDFALRSLFQDYIKRALNELHVSLNLTVTHKLLTIVQQINYCAYLWAHSTVQFVAYCTADSLTICV